MNKAKPYSISKLVVWKAYMSVKANKGTAGVDGESITDFERGLKNNLYKIWNRMSSGSYFPPPVRTVAIPKMMVVSENWVFQLYRIELPRWWSSFILNL